MKQSFSYRNEYVLWKKNLKEINNILRGGQYVDYLGVSSLTYGGITFALGNWENENQWFQKVALLSYLLKKGPKILSPIHNFDWGSFSKISKVFLWDLETSVVQMNIP